VINESMCQSDAKLMNTYGENGTVMCVSESMLDGGVWQMHFHEAYRPKLWSLSDDEKAFAVNAAQSVYDMGLPVIESHGYESDDLAAGLAGVLLNADHEVTIISNDPELCALIDVGVRIIEPFGVERDANWVRKRFGVEPAQLPDYFGLAGNSRMTGVPGVGPLRAVELLKKHGSFDALQSALDGGVLEGMVKSWLYDAVICKTIATPQLNLFRSQGLLF